MVERLCTLFELLEQFIGVKYLYIDSWLPRAGCAASLPFQTHTRTFRHTSLFGFDGPSFCVISLCHTSYTINCVRNVYP